MAAPTQDALLRRFPELAIHPDYVVNGALTTAERICDEDVWGQIHEEGVAYYAAHLVALRTRQVGASIDQKTADPSAEGVMSTFYGQQYEALRQTLAITGFVV